MAQEFMDLPDKSFFPKVFSFLQCFYQLWLIMALCALRDFYLNDVKQLKREREKEKNENLDTYPFSQTLRIYEPLTEIRN